MPIAPQPVSCSAVLTDEREGEEWKGEEEWEGCGRRGKQKAFWFW